MSFASVMDTPQKRQRWRLNIKQWGIELLGVRRSMLSGWERFSKSRTIKEAKLAKNLKHRRFDHQGLVEGKRREGTGGIEERD
jgi:hypothetical protein